MSKNSRDRFVDTFNWKATSERDAICNHAFKILFYRRWAKRLKPYAAWMIGAIIGTLIGCAWVGWEHAPDQWVDALVISGMSFYLGAVLYLVWHSVLKSEDPLYDWAEDYRELLEGRRAFRREEHEQDLPRRKF